MTRLSQPERETLKAVHRCSEPDPWVRTGDLARCLGVSPATATARVQGLADRGLVAYERYRGVRLTPEGARAAAAAIRRHRIVERILSDLLGYAWEDADRLAVAFEHHLPDEVVARFFVALDRPTTCPHGFPIPSVDADALHHLPVLASLDPGDEAVVAIPGSTDPDVVAFLGTLGVRPGVRLTVQEKHPFDGPVVVCVEGRARTLGNKLARHVHVRPTRPVDDQAEVSP